MIDLIRDSITTDFALIWSGTIGCLKFTRGQLEGAVSSNLKKSQGTWFINFDKLIEDFDTIPSIS